jgi:hypothetical protein
MAVDAVSPFMALLSFRGIDTPSLQAQGQQRRLSYFNIDRDAEPIVSLCVSSITRLIVRAQRPHLALELRPP